MLYLIFIGLLNEDCGSLTELLFCALNWILICGLDQRDYDTGRVKADLTAVDELDNHLHDAEIDIWDHYLTRAAFNERTIKHIWKYFRRSGENLSMSVNFLDVLSLAVLINGELLLLITIFAFWTFLVQLILKTFFGIPTNQYNISEFLAEQDIL